jgi:NADH-quinone oxidoreductase subunit A
MWRRLGGLGNPVRIAAVDRLSPGTSIPAFHLPVRKSVHNLQLMDSQLTEYIGVLLLGALAVAATGGMILFSVILGKRGARNKIKDTAYECGMLPVGEGSTRMSVRFYLVAMLFILFDIEVVFMYPWAVVYKQMLADELTRNMILGAMVSFLGILFVGYIYAVKKQAFNWKS